MVIIILNYGGVMVIKDALDKYISFNLKSHDLILSHLEQIIKLPSKNNSSHSSIDLQSNDLIKVYFLNGYLKNSFIKFYDNFILKIDSVVNKYCTNLGININHESELKIKNLIISATQTREKIFQSLDYEDKESVDDKELLYLIRQVHSTSNVLLNFEYKLRSFIDLDDLDIQKGKFFKFFRYNPLYDKTKGILYEFPATVDYSVCIPYFTYTYEKLIDKLEPDNE